MHLELKSFMFQVEQMRMAQIRESELKEQVDKYANVELTKSLWDVREMKRQLETVVDHSIRDFNKGLVYGAGPNPLAVRIAPEQEAADTDFKTALEQNLKTWEAELQQVQKEIVDQAIIDVKDGQRSDNYYALEKRETELKDNISVAKTKLNMVQERVQSPLFANTINEIVTSAKV
ncbi:hypothetical protein KK060_06575 [Fulvivirgaceae bacterium PWU20]|uniref:Uncharacterized protein n=2 Tax=Chryseosolibacter indicus TaxID=2782351 RepID=A0ABS5VNJ4_9BACT|nr:hypothetical protein [Chryseosolibacter indicus]